MTIATVSFLHRKERFPKKYLGALQMIPGGIFPRRLD